MKAKKVLSTMISLVMALALFTVPAGAAEGGFTDVAADAYYANAVAWAVEKSITSGTSETTFSPDVTCTTAQILTFLWRANGSSKSNTANPFTDISGSEYYYDAAMWAYDNGLVTGTKFNAETPCTRSATVTYFWKLANKPSAGSSKFTDVAPDAEYAQAVSWAVSKAITSGTSDTAFSPDATCTRGQIVTFLYRAENPEWQNTASQNTPSDQQTQQSSGDIPSAGNGIGNVGLGGDVDLSQYVSKPGSGGSSTENDDTEWADTDSGRHDLTPEELAEAWQYFQDVVNGKVHYNP